MTGHSWLPSVNFVTSPATVGAILLPIIVRVIMVVLLVTLVCCKTGVVCFIIAVLLIKVHQE